MPPEAMGVEQLEMMGVETEEGMGVEPEEAKAAVLMVVVMILEGEQLVLLEEETGEEGMKRQKGLQWL